MSDRWGDLASHIPRSTSSSVVLSWPWWWIFQALTHVEGWQGSVCRLAFNPCVHTQRSGAEEDSPGRLPPSSSSVLHLLSFLHGSQLLTRVILIHQPIMTTYTNKRRVIDGHATKLTYSCHGSVCVCVCVCISSTCQRRVSGHPRGTPFHHRSSHRTSPPSTPPLSGSSACGCHSSPSYERGNRAKRPHGAKTNRDTSWTNTDRGQTRRTDVNKQGKRSSGLARRSGAYRWERLRYPQQKEEGG